MRLITNKFSCLKKLSLYLYIFQEKKSKIISPGLPR